jgi:hypothetical protein
MSDFDRTPAGLQMIIPGCERRTLPLLPRSKPITMTRREGTMRLPPSADQGRLRRYLTACP